MIEITELVETHHPDDPFWRRRRWCEACDRLLKDDEEYTCYPCDEAYDEAEEQEAQELPGIQGQWADEAQGRWGTRR